MNQRQGTQKTPTHNYTGALLCWEHNGCEITCAIILNTRIVCKMQRIVQQKWHRHFLNGSTKTSHG